MPTISVSIITKNAMPRLQETLESVKWADEIIVLDSGSSDNTVEVSRQYTDKVYETDWPGFGIQHQRALKKCSGDWILSVDSDEVVTEALKNEILKAIAEAPEGINGFAFPRLSYLCNRPIHHCGWRPDYIPRVFRRGFVTYSSDLVHERPLIKGTTEHLKNDLIHYSYDS
ncbi:MAG: glycosyltransferase family 2 protein, partial [Endozoicomonas sp.]